MSCTIVVKYRTEKESVFTCSQKLTYIQTPSYPFDVIWSCKYVQLMSSFYSLEKNWPRKENKERLSKKGFEYCFSKKPSVFFEIDGLWFCYSVGGRGGRRNEIGGGVEAGGVNNLKAAFSLCIQPSRLLVHFERLKALSSL